VHQQNTAAYYTPYTFSGKERDIETGLSYFGARYYDAGLSIWLSVDPMSDERPSLSPYNYCQWNPIKRIDPNGLLDQEASQNGGDPKQKSNTTVTSPTLPTHPTLPNLYSGGGTQTPAPSLPQQVQSMQSERTVPPGTPLQNASLTTQAIGVVTDGAGLALTNVKATNIPYTTPSGSTANVAKTTVTNTFKAISNGTFVAGLMIDAAQTFSGETSPGKFVSNTLVGIGAVTLGGAPGLALTLGYGSLSLTGMLDGPKGSAQPMAPSLMSLPDANVVSPNFVIPKLK
ncbi:MAG: RHS repeat-associated core domain-containing protein, partial [Sphingobacteriaceae bacterium]|nr:RHS repeat-associated core domain-containing protein [Sphingobacteriaceae bacterium]